MEGKWVLRVPESLDERMKRAAEVEGSIPAEFIRAAVRDRCERMEAIQRGEPG